MQDFVDNSNTRVRLALGVAESDYSFHSSEEDPPSLIWVKGTLQLSIIPHWVGS